MIVCDAASMLCECAAAPLLDNSTPTTHVKYGRMDEDRIPERLGRPSAGMTAERAPPVHLIHRRRTPQHSSPELPRAEVDLRRKEEIPVGEYEGPGTRMEGYRLSLSIKPINQSTSLTTVHTSA